MFEFCALRREKKTLEAAIVATKSPDTRLVMRMARSEGIQHQPCISRLKRHLNQLPCAWPSLLPTSARAGTAAAASLAGTRSKHLPNKGLSSVVSCWRRYRCPCHSAALVSQPALMVAASGRSQHGLRHGLRLPMECDQFRGAYLYIVESFPSWLLPALSTRTSTSAQGVLRSSVRTVGAKASLSTSRHALMAPARSSGGCRRQGLHVGTF